MDPFGIRHHKETLDSSNEAEAVVQADERGAAAQLVIPDQGSPKLEGICCA